MVVVLKADGVIVLTMQGIIHLNAIALCNLFRYAALCQIAKQRWRHQPPAYFKILECRFLNKRRRFIRLCHAHIHLFGDVSYLLNKIGLARYYPGGREDVATFSCVEIVPTGHNLATAQLMQITKNSELSM